MKKIKRFVKCMQFVLLLAAAVIVAWSFEPVRNKVGSYRHGVDSYRHEMQSNVTSVTGRTVLALGQKTRRSLLRGNLTRALDEFEGLQGRKPADLQELVRGGFLEKADLVDEWGRRLTVELGQDGIVIRSPGPDGVLHTSDDWVWILADEQVFPSTISC